jgi:hypothetical protein
MDSSIIFAKHFADSSTPEPMFLIFVLKIYFGSSASIAIGEANKKNVHGF